MRFLPSLRSLSLALLALTALIPPASLMAQQADAPQESFVKSHYTKYEFRIPMRDGKRLFTALEWQERTCACCSG